jgi:hypothetical protein
MKELIIMNPKKEGYHNQLGLVEEINYKNLN